MDNTVISLVAAVVVGFSLGSFFMIMRASIDSSETASMPPECLGHMLDLSPDVYAVSDCDNCPWWHACRGAVNAQLSREAELPPLQ